MLWPDKKNLVVAFDTETTGLFNDDPCSHCNRGVHVTAVSAAWDDGAFAIPFALPEANNESYQTWRNLMRWLAQQHLVAHNLKFDLHQLSRGAPNGWQGFDLSSSAIWDTRLACSVIWPLDAASLKPTAERLWGKDDPGIINKAAAMKAALDELPKGQKYDFWRIPWETQGPYATDDAILTLRLYHEQNSVLDTLEGLSEADRETAENMRVQISREFALGVVLFKMEERGIGFDAIKALKVAQKLLREKDKITEAAPFRLTRMEALKFWEANEKAKLDTIEFDPTPTGQASLDHKGLERAAAAGLTYADEFIRLLDIDRALSLWFSDEGWAGKVGPDSRLRTDYNQGSGHGGPREGTVNGRLSSQRVNLQAIPKEAKTTEKGLPDVRMQFVPKPGNVLVELDLSNAELRVAARVAECEKMIRAFENGEDPHTNTTIKVFGAKPSDPDWDTVRKHAKTMTFAILYGSGVSTLIETLGEGGKIVDYGEAQKLIREFNEQYPEFRRTMEDVQKAADSRGYVVLISGRRRYFAPGENTWKAFNSVIQGGVAELVKDMMVYVEENYPGWLLLQIHDSLVLEVPEKEIDRIPPLATTLERMATEMFGIPMPLGIKGFGADKDKEKKWLKK